MARQQLSLKQIAIDKNNTAIVIAVGLASFIVVFSLVASQALLQQRGYQAKAIKQKETAVRGLKSSKSEVEKLQVAYTAFADSPQNALGGNIQGSGDKDGDNPRLVLDALPSKYDFPALTTSLEKVFKDYQIRSIEGVDDEANQAAVEASGTPALVEMPFTISLASSTSNARNVLQVYEKSIRPFQVQKVKFKGEKDKVIIDVTAKTYMQGSKKFDVKKETLR